MSSAAVKPTQILHHLQSQFDTFQSLSQHHKQSHANFKKLFQHTTQLHATLQSIVRLPTTYNDLISAEELAIMRREQDKIQTSVDAMRGEITTYNEDDMQRMQPVIKVQKQMKQLQNPMYTVIDSHDATNTKTTRTDLTTTKTNPNTNTRTNLQTKTSFHSKNNDTESTRVVNRQHNQRRTRPLLSNSEALRVSTDDTRALQSVEADDDTVSQPLSDDVVSILQQSKKRLPYTNSSSSSAFPTSLLASNSVHNGRNLRIRNDTDEALLSSFDNTSQSNGSYTLQSLPTHHVYKNQYQRKRKLHTPQSQPQTSTQPQLNQDKRQQHGGRLLLKALQLHSCTSHHGRRIIQNKK